MPVAGSRGRDAAAAGQGAGVGLRGRRPRGGVLRVNRMASGATRTATDASTARVLAHHGNGRGGAASFVRLGLAARPRHGGSRDDEGDERDAISVTARAVASTVPRR